MGFALLSKEDQLWRSAWPVFFGYLFVFIIIWNSLEIHWSCFQGSPGQEAKNYTQARINLDLIHKKIFHFQLLHNCVKLRPRIEMWDFFFHRCFILKNYRSFFCSDTRDWQRVDILGSEGPPGLHWRAALKYGGIVHRGPCIWVYAMPHSMLNLWIQKDIIIFHWVFKQGTSSKAFKGLMPTSMVALLS